MDVVFVIERLINFGPYLVNLLRYWLLFTADQTIFLLIKKTYWQLLIFYLRFVETKET